MATLKNDWVDLEMISDSGAGNGTTVDFVTTSNIKSSNSTLVFVDGLLRNITTDYTISLVTDTVSFVIAPAYGQKINIRYFKR
jgi:hypothetical protein